jgi:hypothetical protein
MKKMNAVYLGLDYGMCRGIQLGCSRFDISDFRMVKENGWR